MNARITNPKPSERESCSLVGSARYRIQERPMKNRLLVSTVVAASLLAPAAFAQTSAPPDNTGPSGAETKAPATHHAMKSTHMKRDNTTIGMGSGARTRPGGESVARKPAD
jgi:hypothetical protein